MTEPAAVSVRDLAPDALIAVEIWTVAAPVVARLREAIGGDLPGLNRSAALTGGWRALRVEPTVWWLSGPLADTEAMMDRIERTLGDDGAVADLSSGFARLAVQGPRWRELLMFGGVLDAEDPAFGPGSTAGTLLHHIGVRYDIVDEALAHIHVAPSYAADLLDHLWKAAARL